ncbi:hypothetical protein HY479_02015 [Candidatus Uhrbacteria bacterium]|nr:hypothetical protein [Candidatus Uhrbacteria bacterium]
MTSHRHANAWVVSVNMGYGHERAAYALKDLARGGIITANDYPGIPDGDKRLWVESRRIYELLSRVKPIPLIGDPLFSLIDKTQRIAPFYPRRDLSQPSSQVRQTYFMIEKLGLGKHLIEKLSKKPLPLICTFFIPAFAAETYGYPGEIYLVICDADISRAWVAKDPKKSRIKYFAPNGRVVERLKLYGIKPENIFLTGFPLPKEVIGGPEGVIIKKDLITRICNLDPNGIFRQKYQRTLDAELGPGTCPMGDGHRPITLVFSVGGAGAQKKLGVDMVRSLKHRIQTGRIIVRLAAGTKTDVADYFTTQIKQLGLKRCLGKGIHVDSEPDRTTYFHRFTKRLRTTDILWTKPSEMSFYSGVGLPIIMAPSIGSQEAFNRIWLKTVNAGVTQGDPRYTDEWLFDWINSGGLARMAWNGYIEAPTHGSYRIESIITGEKIELEKLPMIV